MELVVQLCLGCYSYMVSPTTYTTVCASKSRHITLPPILFPVCRSFIWKKYKIINLFGIIKTIHLCEIYHEMNRRILPGKLVATVFHKGNQP